MNAPWKPGTIGARDPFSCFVGDEATADVVRIVAGEMGWSPDKVFGGGLRAAIQSLAVSASPQVLLVDLTGSGDPLNDINGLAEVCEPGTVVIALGQVNDVRLYRGLLASGIHDYLLKPLHPEMLRDALAQTLAMLNAPKASDGAVERPHCAVAVIGARGGVGASTVAASLAWLMAEQAGRSTALLDLDVHFGTGALALDLEPGRGLTDAMENPSRIDGLFIERAMVRASEKLAVLSAEAPINAPPATDGTVFRQLQEEMRAAFETTVVDLPRAMLVQYPTLMADVPIAVIVTELTLAAARDTIRLLSWLKTHAPQTQVHLLCNRMIANGQPEIARKDFEGSIERKLDHVLPYDQKLVAQAAKLGKPIAEVGKGGKTVAPLGDLMTAILTTVDGEAAGVGLKRAGGSGSLIGKLGALIAKRPAKKA